jgi:endonuclease YncB( thermonuclease family)
VRVIAAIALASVVGCAGESPENAQAGRYDRLQLEHALAAHDAGIELGIFSLTNKPVVDGDTIKVVGLDASLRLLGLDCEETFKSEKDWRRYEQGFDAYLKTMQGDSNRPVKVATPLGMDAKKFAMEFFEDVSEVKLERDHPKDIRDRYNRYLAYVLVKKGKSWVNYNVECVRAGMSPYFTKYGFASRYHEDFVEAQEEARAAKRGIWDPAKEHYRDYDVRLRWWDARGEFVAQFEAVTRGRNEFIVLTHWDALDRLAQHEGKEVELLGTVGDIRIGRGGAPTRVMLGRRMFADFPLVFFDDAVFDKTGLARATGEFVHVRGTVTKYKFKKKRGRPAEEQLQIVVKRPEQIVWVDTLAAALAPPAEPVEPTPAEPTPVEPATPEAAPVDPASPEPPTPAPSEPPPPSPPADASPTLPAPPPKTRLPPPPALSAG